LSRVEDPEESPGRAAGAFLPSTPIDSQLKAKALEQADRSLRQPLAAEVVDEFAALMREPRSNAPFGITGRVAATVGILAFVALLFLILMPGVQQHDTAQSLSADVQQFKAALSRKSQPQPSSGETAKPAIAEFQSLLTPSSGEQAALADHDQNDILLRKFLQWRQKTDSAANAR
jgi:hypothetical protein